MVAPKACVSGFSYPGETKQLPERNSLGLSAGALTLLEVASIAGAYLAWGNWMSITLPTKMEFFRFAPASDSLPETIAGMVLGSLPGVLILYLVRTKPERMIWLSLLISLVCVALYCFATILAGRRFELKRETIVGSISSLFLLGFVLLLCAPVANRAQESKDDLVRVRTRVVFVDTLVQDKQTGAPVADLTRANFEILADGKPRTLSYFSRAAEGHRRPLALLLVLDLVARDTGE